MKIKNLFFAAAAVLGVIACQNKQTAEGVTVSPEEIEFAKEGETKEVTITTADAWKISVPEEASWLELSEKSGTGTTKISIKAAANTEWDRSASLTVKAGMYSAKIKVSQAGNGEKVESAIEKLLAIELQKDEVRTGAVDLKDVWWVAKYEKTGIVTDGTAKILVYSKDKAVDGAVGEKGDLTGDLTSYSYRHQVINPTFTKTGTVEVNHGTALEMKTEIDKYDWQNSKIVYVHVVGTCRKNGNYYNIFLDGCTKDVSFASLSEDGSKYADKEIEFYGYFVSGTNHVSVLPVGDITVKGDAAPEIKLTVSAKQTQDGFEASWNEVATADSYVWAIYEGPVEEEVVIGQGSVTTTSINVSNDDLDADISEGLTYYVVVTAYDSEQELITAQASFIGRDMSGSGDEVTLTLTQEQLAALACKGAANALDDVITLTNSSDYGSNPVTELRIYKNQSMTLTANGASIVSVELTCTANGTTKQGPGCFGAGAPEGYTFEAEGKKGTWVGNETSLVFTATDNQVRVAGLTIIYSK